MKKETQYHTKGHAEFKAHLENDVIKAIEENNKQVDREILRDCGFINRSNCACLKIKDVCTCEKPF